MAHCDTVSDGSSASPRAQARIISLSPSNASAEFEFDVRELGEVPWDILFKDRFHLVRFDVQLGRHQRGNTRRPLHPGIALTPRQAEDRCNSAGAINQLPLDLGEANAPLLHLDDFVRGAGAEESNVTFLFRTRVLQCLLNGI